MVCLAENYKTYQRTGRVYGHGIKGFGLSGLGTQTFGYGCNGSAMALKGNGMPAWFIKAKDSIVTTARTALPWIRTVGMQLAKKHAKDVADFVADEIEHSNKDAYPALAKIAADATRRTGSIVQSQLKKGSKNDQKLSPAQHVATDMVQSASEQLLRQMLSGRNAEKKEGNGTRGLGNNSQNILTY